MKEFWLNLLPIDQGYKLPIPPDAKPLKPDDCYCGAPAVYKPEGKRGYCGECWTAIMTNSGMGVSPKGGGQAQG